MIVEVLKKTPKLVEKKIIIFFASSFRKTKNERKGVMVFVFVYLNSMIHSNEKFVPKI
jgi:hypothetical protein